MSNASDIKKVWFDGELVDYAQATVPILSHTLHYGTGAFEGIRAYLGDDGQTYIFRGRDHLQRLLNSVRALGTHCPYTVDTLLQASIDTIRANGFKECYLRPIAYLGDSHRGLKLPENMPMKVAIIAWPWGKYMGDEGQNRGIRVMVCSYRRADVSTGLPWAKLNGGYLYSVLARRQATLSGCDESILLDQQGYVAEGSGENLFLVNGNVLTTPPHGNILPGFTRDSIIQIARRLGYEVREEPIIRNQMYLAEELFFTGTAIEVNAICEVDGHQVGAGTIGPVTRKLTDTFFKAVRGTLPEYSEWLNRV